MKRKKIYIEPGVPLDLSQFVDTDTHIRSSSARSAASGDPPVYAEGDTLDYLLRGISRNFWARVGVAAYEQRRSIRVFLLSAALSAVEVHEQKKGGG